MVDYSICFFMALAIHMDMVKHYDEWHRCAVNKFINRRWVLWNRFNWKSNAYIFMEKMSPKRSFGFTLKWFYQSIQFSLALLWIYEPKIQSQIRKRQHFTCWTHDSNRISVFSFPFFVSSRLVFSRSISLPPCASDTLTHSLARSSGSSKPLQMLIEMRYEESV